MYDSKKTSVYEASLQAERRTLGKVLETIKGRDRRRVGDALIDR